MTIKQIIVGIAISTTIVVILAHRIPKISDVTAKSNAFKVTQTKERAPVAARKTQSDAQLSSRKLYR